MLSNYSIKKMIPRLVIAAILVNVSFYLAAAAVDISNLLGYNLIRLFDTISIAESGQLGGTSNLWTEVVGNILLIGVGVALIVLVIAAPTVLLALGLVVLILIARKALILLLVVIAPVAFVAWLLPNTEEWFKKWWKMFFALLMVFPIIALVFGASKLASDILIAAAKGDTETDYMMLVAGLATAALPLFAVPSLLKGAIAAAGTVGGKLQGYADRAQGNAMNTAKQKGKQAYDSSIPGQFMKYRAGEKKRRTAMAQSGRYKGWRPDLRLKSKIAQKTLPRMGAFGETVTSAGADLEDKIWDEKVGNQQKLMVQEGHDDDTLHEMATNTSGKYTQEQSAAAAGLVMKNGSMESIQRLHDSVEAMGDTDRAGGIRKQMIHDMNRTPFGYGASDIAAMKRGKATGKGNYSNMIRQRASNKLSDSKWASMDPADQKRLVDLAEAGQLDDLQLQNLTNATYAAQTNDNISVTDEATAWGERIRSYANNERNIHPQLHTPETPTPQQQGGGESPQPPSVPTFRTNDERRQSIENSTQYSASTPESPEFTRQQVGAMSPEHAQRAVEARGGVENLHSSDVIHIAHQHAGSEVGQQARAELTRRGIMGEQRAPHTSQPPQSPPQN